MTNAVHGDADARFDKVAELIPPPPFDISLDISFDALPEDSVGA